MMTKAFFKKWKNFLKHRKMEKKASMEHQPPSLWGVANRRHNNPIVT
jgi:hypothetical protein